MRLHSLLSFFFFSFSCKEKNICVVQSPLKSACINLLNKCIKSEYRNGFSSVGLSPIGDFASYIFSSFILSLRADSTLPQENCSCCMLWLNLRILGAWRQWCLPEPSLCLFTLGFHILLTDFHFLPHLQMVATERHWCILLHGWGCWGWRGSCCRSQVAAELSASTTKKERPLWAWPWSGVITSCTGF